MIGLLLCKTLGEIIGEIDEHVFDDYENLETISIVNAERVQLTAQGGMVLPVLAMSDDNVLVINKDELISPKVYKLQGEIEKQYRERYNKVILPNTTLKLLD